MSAPLEGIRVVEIASFVAAPSAGALRADLGAEVIKVEVPEGELYRHTRPRMNGFSSDIDLSPAFEMDNRGKRSLALDLTKPEALAALLRMDIITKDDGRYVTVDSLYREWVARKTY